MPVADADLSYKSFTWRNEVFGSLGVSKHTNKFSNSFQTLHKQNLLKSLPLEH